MNGAESLVRTLTRGGVGVCFTNPGTSEIHFVEALDRVREMRAVPCLFEGVAVGAADGYARMTGRPAATLLHLGPGLSNGLANLHNARRAHVPLLNIVGDHATYHRQYDAPLTSDIEAIARSHSAWLRTSRSAGDVGKDCADAIAAARLAPGGIATLIVPADAAWSDGGKIGEVSAVPPPPAPVQSVVDEIALLLRNGLRTAILLGDRSAQGASLAAAGRIAAATGAALFVPFSFSRVERGRGRPTVERVAYVAQQAMEQLREFRQLILVSAPAPVAFFAHPARPSVLTPKDCAIHTLARSDENHQAALDALEAALPACAAALPAQESVRPERPRGAIALAGLAAAVGATLPAQAIVVDESITSGRSMMAAARAAPLHDWLVNTGGSIGIGTPLAVGAAVACPDRPVLCLSGDGSLMYTLQSLWTAARENLAVTTVVFANRSYDILKGELANLGNNGGPRALEILDIGRPPLDFASLAKGLGIPALRVTSLEEFGAALQSGFESRGPNLIEVPL